MIVVTPVLFLTPSTVCGGKKAVKDAGVYCVVFVTVIGTSVRMES